MKTSIFDVCVNGEQLGKFARANRDMFVDDSFEYHFCNMPYYVISSNSDDKKALILCHNPYGKEYIDIDEFSDLFFKEFKKEPKFKDGDYIHMETDLYEFIAIFKRFNGNSDNDMDYHAMYMLHCDKVMFNNNGTSDGYKLATEEQKKAIDGKLKYIGVSFDKETKSLKFI